MVHLILLGHVLPTYLMQRTRYELLILFAPVCSCAQQLWMCACVGAGVGSTDGGRWVRMKVE